MSETTYKAGIRSMLDGSREALEHAISDSVSDLCDALTEGHPGHERRCIACDHAWHGDQPSTDKVHGDGCIVDASLRTAEAIIEQLRQLVTAERALTDNVLRQIEMGDDDFAALVKKYRERAGR